MTSLRPDVLRRMVADEDTIAPRDLFAATAPDDIPRDFMPRPLPFALPGYRKGMGASQTDDLARQFDTDRRIAWRWHWADKMLEARRKQE